MEDMEELLLEEAARKSTNKGIEKKKKRNNIRYEYSLSDYNHKFSKRSYRLISFTADEVKEFDKKQGNDIDEKELLKGNRWWFIDGVYHQVPRVLTLTWFANLF